MVKLPTQRKYAGETKEFRIDFDDDLIGAVTVSSGTVAVEGRYTGTDATSTIANSAVATVSSPFVSGIMKAGTAGDHYLVTYTATLSDGNIVQRKFFLHIVENQQQN